MKKLGIFLSTIAATAVSTTTIALANGATGASGGGLSALTTNIRGQAESAISLVFIGGFAVGIIFVLVGLMKLKAAADSGGQQVKYGEGIWRLGVGSALVALPLVTGVGVETIFGKGTEVQGSQTFDLLTNERAVDSGVLGGGIGN